MYQVRCVKDLRPLQLIGGSETASKTNNINFRSLSEAQNVCDSSTSQIPQYRLRDECFFFNKSHLAMGFEIKEDSGCDTGQV